MASLRIPLASAPAAVLEWIIAHPGQTALLVVNGAIMISPAAITAPVLGMMGWGALGPGAGTTAAWLQGALSPIGGGSLFSIAQSAGMGGYGAAIVNGVTQGAAAVSAASPYAVRFAVACWRKIL